MMPAVDRQDDRVAPAIHVFSDFEKTSPMIFLKIEEEHLPLDGQFFCGDRLTCFWHEVIAGVRTVM